MADEDKTPIHRVVRTGNSLAVVVPARFVNQAGIQAGDQVDVTINYQEGKITYIFPVIRQLNLV